MSARRDLYEFIKNNGKGKISGEVLRKVGRVSGWARVLRQLKQDGVVSFKYLRSEMAYDIFEINEYTSKTVRSGLSSKDRYRIRNRDGHRCQSCGKSAKDGIELHVDHKIPVEFDGSNDDSNLWTLCADCNQGKRDFYKDDFDAELMKLVYKQSSGYQKLKVLFENSKGKKYTPSIIQGIAGIRDWTRTIRDIRNKENLNIQWYRPNKNYPNGYYLFD